MKQPFRLVALDAPVSHDTVKCLEALLERAKQGDIIGIAYAVMYRRREFRVHTCGEMHRNPTFTRGAVAALNDQVSRQQWGGQ